MTSQAERPLVFRGDPSLSERSFKLLGSEGRLPTEEEIIQTAQLFAEVFTGEPWYEVSRCEGCGSFSPREPGQDVACGRCQTGVLVPAYPVDKMAEVVRSLVQRPDATLHLVDNNGIQGFAWGYPMGLGELLGRTFEKQHRKQLRYVFRRLIGEVGEDRIFSAAEVGVRESYRGRGVGKFLFSRLLQDGRARGLRTTVWTRADAVLTPICVKFGLAQVYGPRVILEDGVLHETGEVLIGRHKDMPQRVMFVREAGGQI